MKKVVLSHMTALYWLLGHSNYLVDSSIVCRVSPKDAVAAGNDLAQHLLGIMSYPGKLDCLVCEPRLERRTSCVRTHLSDGKLPAECLIPIECAFDDVDLFVCRPELVYMQLSKCLSDQETIYFGMALCSGFRLEPAAQGGVVFRQGYDAPLISASKITSYLQRVPGPRTPKRGLRLIRRVADHARSPKECALGMLFALPVRLGGYGLGSLTFNPEYRVYSGVDRFGDARYGTRIPDLLLEAKDTHGNKRAVAVDYDPASTHAGDIKELLDTRRRNDIATIRGLPHFAITSEDIKSFEYLDLTAERIRRALGKRVCSSLEGAAESWEGRERLEEAQRARRALWRQFVVPPFEGVIKDLPLEKSKGTRHS